MERSQDEECVTQHLAAAIGKQLSDGLNCQRRIYAAALAALQVLRGDLSDVTIAIVWLLLAGAAAVHAGPADAVVRLKSHGGSGTAIATGEGWTLILSCAHCFEGPDRTRPIVLDMPHNAPGLHKKVGVRVLQVGRTETVDLSLIKLNAGPVPYVTPISPLANHPRECWSVGYDELKIPAKCRPARIVGQEGSRTLTDARPWHGRSGGPLIDKETGFLVGVCSAYTGPSDGVEYRRGEHGIYVSLPAIHAFLVKAGVMRPSAGDAEDPFAPELRRPRPFPCPGGSCPIPGPRYERCPGGSCPIPR
jgi:hypothetical protein